MVKVSQFALVLSAGTFLATSASAFDVTSSYLNSLTGPNISWSDSTGTEVQVGDQTFYYTYTKPTNYEETSTSLDGNFTNDDVTNKLFTGINGTDEMSAAVMIKNATDSVEGVEIVSDFVDNSVNVTGPAYGAGIIFRASDVVADKVQGNFINNKVVSSGAFTVGPAIFLSHNSTGNKYAIIRSIEGNFINNLAENTGSGYVHAGAIDNHGQIDSVKGNFIGNHAKAKGGYAVGGAISNDTLSSSDAQLGTVNANFIGNIAESDIGYAHGGAINNTSSLGNILNSNFVNNKVIGNENSHGGAIYSSKDLPVTADNGTSLFEGNTVNGESNAIYMDGTNTSVLNLNLTGTNNGIITFNDNIDGQYYNINVMGSNNGEVVFNQKVEHFHNLSISEEAIMHMGLNADISGKSMVFSGTGGSKPTIKVDLEVDKANQTTKTGMITLSGDVSGDYNVIVNSMNTDAYDGAYAAFLTALNDTDSSDESFTVSRVIGNPYMWKALLNYQGETEGSTWYLALDGEVNPDPDPDPDPDPKPRPDVTPEVIAGVGLHEAAIEQTRSVAHNVKGKVAAGREFCPGCGSYDYGWDGDKLRNLWVLAQGENANIDKPVDMEAKIWGVEAGFDFQSDIHNTLGVFVSYRDGEYDLSGKGSKLRSPIGSSIDIDSYLAGLYYRYDKNMNWLFATVYGGIQKAEVKTDDGVAKFDTDGIEFGAGIEVGRTIPLASDLTLDPSIGLYYTQVNFDDADDNVGKHYEWDDIKHLEAELGAKLEKQFDNAKVYVKPSVIQTLTDDDSVVITGLNKADTYHDQTLGRIEIGGRYGFTDALSAYAWTNYTFGSSYDAFGIGAGLNYAW